MLFDLEKYGKRIALISESGKRMSYLSLYKDGQMILSSIKNNEAVWTRPLVFCLCKNTIGSVVGYVALMNGGVPTLLLDASKPYEVLKKLIDIYRPSYLWLPADKTDEYKSHGSVVCAYEDYSLLATDTEVYPIHPDVLLLLTTSGSTGSPKLVKISERNLSSNAISIAEYLEIDDSERPITSLPMHYSFGMSVLNSHLIKGATILLTEKSILQREFWQFLEKEKATSMSGVPYTYEMLKRLRFSNMDLPWLKTLIQAGGKLSPDLVLEYVESAHKKGRRFIVMYGQTEASPRMSYLPFDHAKEKCSSIGIAIPGGRFALQDVHGNPIEASEEEGELVYEGPNVCLGYAHDMSDLAKGDEMRGVLHTGDIAKRDGDGYYYITGRMKRFVKIWGNRCNLDSLEQMVKSITLDCACVGVDDRITVFVIKEGLEEQIKDMLSERTGLNKRAFSVVTIENIPKNTSGKVQYQELQKRIEI